MVRKMAGEKRNDREWRIKRDKDTQTHTAVGQTLREPQDLARVLPGSWDLASAPPPQPAVNRQEELGHSVHPHLAGTVSGNSQKG